MLESVDNRVYDMALEMVSVTEASDEWKSHYEILKEMGCSEREWNSKHRAKFIKTWKNMLNAIRQVIEQNGWQDMVATLNPDEEHIGIAEMDSWRGGDKHDTIGHVAKSLLLYRYRVGGLSKRKLTEKIDSTLSKTIDNLIPKEYRDSSKSGSIIFYIKSEHHDGTMYNTGGAKLITPHIYFDYVEKAIKEHEKKKEVKES